MDFETYMELCYGVPEEITAPDEEIPPYDPYPDEQYEVEHYLDQEAYLEAQIEHWIQEEGY